MQGGSGKVAGTAPVFTGAVFRRWDIERLFGCYRNGNKGNIYWYFSFKLYRYMMRTKGRYGIWH